jgi:hypothetical protein
MITLQLEIELEENKILEKLINILQNFNGLKIKQLKEVNEYGIEYISDKEQKEIEKLLKNSDCEITVFSEVIDL